LLGQLPTGLSHGYACPVGGGADVEDRCEEGVLPEVVGLASTSSHARMISSRFQSS